LLGIIRVAVTGKTVAPPLFETIAILGQTKSLTRIDRAIKALAALAT
jgi:glutamyl-tRNA synthetase